MGGGTDVQQVTPIIPDPSPEESYLQKLLTGFVIDRTNPAFQYNQMADRLAGVRGLASYSPQNDPQGRPLDYSAGTNGGTARFGSNATASAPSGIVMPWEITGKEYSSGSTWEPVYDPINSPYVALWQKIFNNPNDPKFNPTGTVPSQPKEPPDNRRLSGNDKDPQSSPAPAGIWDSTHSMVDAFGLGGILGGAVPSAASEISSTALGRGYTPGAVKQIESKYGVYSPEANAARSSSGERNTGFRNERTQTGGGNGGGYNGEGGASGAGGQGGKGNTGGGGEKGKDGPRGGHNVK